MTLLPFAEFWQHSALIEMPENAVSAQLIRFANFRRGPQAHPLKTDNGKTEIYSARIAGYDYVDCGGYPIWLEPNKWFDNAEPDQLRLSFTHLAHRLHSQSNYSTLRKQYTVADREPIAIHPQDTHARGIVDGDTVRVRNQRGQASAGTVAIAGIEPGVICIHEGARPGLNLAMNGIYKNGAISVPTKGLPSPKLGDGCAGSTALARLGEYSGPTLALTASDPPANP